MSAFDWEEVKRLAADFQRAQLTSSAQRLSEKNCIEIINRLIEEKLIDVVFTTNGKEYITPQHLAKEIKDELFVCGGRINLVDLAKILLVDLQVVARKASEIEKSDSSIRIVNGQLISNAYTTTLCIEINEKLEQLGQISVGDLTSHYDLPSEFLLSVIEKNLGRLIHGIQDKQDREIFFTSKFVERNLSIFRGALLAVTRPISIASLTGFINVPERVFFSAVDSLIERKEMPGVITGKQKTAGSYVPYIYTKAQQDWVNSFYQQNGYLEFQSMTRLGISDPAGFIQKTLSKVNLVLLSSVAVGPSILDQVEGALDEAVSSSSFVKILQILPSVFEDNDVEALLLRVLQSKKSAQHIQIFSSTVVVTDQYIKEILKKHDDKIEEVAKKFVDSGDYMKCFIEKPSNKTSLEEKIDIKMDRKEERRKKAAEGKGGGGTQGRETKTKSTKKKYLKGKMQQGNSDEELDRGGKASHRVEILNRNNVVSYLQGDELLQDEDDDNLLEELADYLHPILNKKAVEVARVLFESTIASANQNRRKKHLELQEKLMNLLLNVRLFERGIKLLENIDVSTQLTKYLLKSVCTDIVNEVFGFVGECDVKDMSTEQRLKILADAPADLKDVLSRLHRSLSGNSVEEFFTAAEVALGPGGVDIMVYKQDKKKERPQILHQRELLIEQLNIANDPALVLHLTVLIVFQAVTQNLIHASGKFVSNIISFLKEKIAPEDFEALTSYHDLVLQYLSNPENRGNIGSALQENMLQIKDIAYNAKKNSSRNKERTSSATLT